MKLKELMSEDEALDVVTKNPGLLTCNPASLQEQSADSIKRAAAVVDIVETVPVGARWGLLAAASAGVVALVGNGAISSLN